MILSDNICSLRCFVVLKYRGRPVTMDSTVYLVKGEKLALIDTGHAPAAQGLLDQMRFLDGYDPHGISYILLTHAHADHSGGTRAFKKSNPKAVVACHRIGKEAAEIYGETEIDRVLEDGDVIDLGEGQQLKVVHCPGHSSDSISFLTTIEGALITGDSVEPTVSDAFEKTPSIESSTFGGPYVERVLWVGIWTDAKAYIATLNRVKRIDFQTMLPGHGVPLHGETAKRHIDRCIESFQTIDRIVAESTGENCRTIAREVCKRYKGFGKKNLPEEPWNTSIFTLETINAHLRMQGRL